EEAILELVEFLGFAVALLELLAVLIQFVAQGEFTKADPVVKPAPRDDENTSYKQEVEVVKKYACGAGRIAQQACGEVGSQRRNKYEDTVHQSPAQHNRGAEHHEIQSSVVRRVGSVGGLDH